MTKPTTVREFFKHYPDDETCLTYLFDVRFGQGHVCPKCERSARWYLLKSEPAFSCQWCGHHIHPMVGTLFAKSRTPLQLWFYAVFLFTKTRRGVSAKELQRQLGVTYKCAFRMARRIRKHMAAIDGDEPLGGPGEIVEVDGASIGGKAHGRPGRPTKKAVVLGMAERNGRVTAEVVPNVKGETRQSVIVENVVPGTEIHADVLANHDKPDRKGHGRRRINKEATGRHVTHDGVTENAVENFWRHLKCSIQGTHVSVSQQHRQKYVKEFEHRFNRRTTPSAMLAELLGRYPELEAAE
jgi:transposase-like protein